MGATGSGQDRQSDQGVPGRRPARHRRRPDVDAEPAVPDGAARLGHRTAQHHGGQRPPRAHQYVFCFFFVLFFYQVVGRNQQVQVFFLSFALPVNTKTH